MDAVDRKSMQERGLNVLARHKGGFQFTNTFFPYTSGEIGPYYVQSGVVQNDGHDYNGAIDDMSELVRSAVGEKRVGGIIISGGETRDWIFSLPVALKLYRPHVMLYNDGKMVGASGEIKGREVVHVADLNNEGSSPRDKWVPIIKKAEGTIRDIFFYVDRMEGGVDVVKDLGLNSHAVVPLDEHAWDYLQKTGVVSAEVYRNLMARGKSQADRDEWAEAMLKSRAGQSELVKLFDNEKSREKVRKILSHGYAYLKSELLDVLKRESRSGLDVGEWAEGM